MMWIEPYYTLGFAIESSSFNMLKESEDKLIASMEQEGE